MLNSAVNFKRKTFKNICELSKNDIVLLPQNNTLVPCCIKTVDYMKEQLEFYGINNTLQFQPNTLFSLHIEEVSNDNIPDIGRLNIN